mmetsp:Transcript_37374/g.76690  ORF Transcript_37374/g.76690 Transcript_37374/m.76690 type:complete len:238 (+) Transcript_37374:225-938(+)
MGGRSVKTTAAEGASGLVRDAWRSGVTIGATYEGEPRWTAEPILVRLWWGERGTEPTWVKLWCWERGVGESTADGNWSEPVRPNTSVCRTAGRFLCNPDEPPSPSPPQGERPPDGVRRNDRALPTDARRKATDDARLLGFRDPERSAPPLEPVRATDTTDIRRRNSPMPRTTDWRRTLVISPVSWLYTSSSYPPRCRRHQHVVIPQQHNTPTIGITMNSIVLTAKPDDGGSSMFARQ